MVDIVIEPTQSPHQDSQIEEMVEQLEAVDRALGQHLALCDNKSGTHNASSDRACPRGAQWYRERIAEWCRDPAVREACGAEPVLSTELAVPHLRDEELLALVKDLIDRASGGGARESTKRRRARRAG